MLDEICGALTNNETILISYNPHFILILLVFITTSVTACATYTPKQPFKDTSPPELVMPVGMVITAKTPHGLISIEATGEITRKYSWDSKSFEFELIPRTSRWVGEKGIHRPYWSRTSIDRHAILNEGQQHFCVEDELLEYLRPKSSYTDAGRTIWRGYTSDGLF